MPATAEGQRLLAPGGSRGEGRHCQIRSARATISRLRIPAHRPRVRTVHEEGPRYSEWGSSIHRTEDYNLEAFVSSETTLADHLAEQLSLTGAHPAGA